MFGLPGAGFDLGLVQIFEIRLLPVVRLSADGGNVQAMRSFHVGSVVEAADERIGRNVHRAFDVAVAPQREIRPQTISGRPAKLHRDAGGSHRQIEGVFEFDLLGLRQTELAGNVGNRLLWKHDRAGTHRSDAAGELNVFDCFREALQSTAILFEKTQPRAIDLTVDQKTHEALVPKNGGKRELPLGAIEGGGDLAKWLVVYAGRVLVRRVAHRRVIPVEVQRAHWLAMISAAYRSLPAGGPLSVAASRPPQRPHNFSARSRQEYAWTALLNSFPNKS